MTASYPPRHAPGLPGTAKQAAIRFTTERTLSGFAVIDFDGRPVAERERYHEARELSADLNAAAFGGGLIGVLESEHTFA